MNSCAVVTEGQKSAVEEGTDLMGDTFPTKYNAYIDAQHSAAQFTYNVVRHQGIVQHSYLSIQFVFRKCPICPLPIR